MILNDEQEKAVHSNDQFIFLLAGAGSGKTRVIVERIKHLISSGVKEKEILAITFTKKASIEMKSRLSNQKIEIHTFHAYCYKRLSERNQFKIFEADQRFTDDEILAIANYKNSLYQTKKPKVFEIYQMYLKEKGLMDYDDLMLETIKYVKHHPFKYIFIDEFQDTNLLQFKLLETMIKKDTFVFTVGDPDQSIYAFRGARFELIDKFISKYQAKVYKLTKNYRSNDCIIDAANNLISHNKNRFKKALISQRTATIKPEIILTNKEKFINSIINLIKTKSLHKVVILYRNHYQVSELREALERNYLFDVKLLSFHESKGLEFNQVIIVGAEILPYDKEHTFFGEEEERRLLFVGITRAIHELYIFSLKKTKFLKQTKIDVRYI